MNKSSLPPPSLLGCCEVQLHYLEAWVSVWTSLSNDVPLCNPPAIAPLLSLPASLKTENSVLTASGAYFTGFFHPHLPRRLEKVPCSSEVVQGWKSYNTRGFSFALSFCYSSFLFYAVPVYISFPLFSFFFLIGWEFFIGYEYYKNLPVCNFFPSSLPLLVVWLFYQVEV